MKWVLQMGIFLWLIFCSSGFSETLKIAADVSLKGVLSELAQNFTGAASTNQIQLNFAPSGILRKKIKEENWDVIIMTTKGEMQLLTEAQLIEKESIKALAKNRLVVVSAWPVKGTKSWMERAETEWKRLVVANPDTTMSGVAARMVLEAEGFLESWRGKMIYESSSEKVLEWIKRGKADAGFLYQSDIVYLKPKETFSVFEVNEMLYPSIQYYGAILKTSLSAPKAGIFLDWLTQESNRSVWKAWGFEKP